jgi:mannose-6-phosphate isomerase
MIYVGAGTVHTLGPGSILVETQQQSDATYRLYDYGRPRELHLEQGLAAIKSDAVAGKVSPAPMSSVAPGEGARLVLAPYFAVNKYTLSRTQQFSTSDPGGSSSVQILVAVEGSATVGCEDCASVDFGKGDAVVIPASARTFRVHAKGQVEFLVSRVPERVMREPVTQP